jgi:hypothetical protein
MERRRANRYSLRMKANIHALSASAIMQPIETWTRDVSAKGLFLDMAEPFAVGTRIKIVLELPAEVVGNPVLLHCVSRVVRIVEKEDGTLGVGAVIESYEFVHPGNA